jgi:hypothetical protein
MGCPPDVVQRTCNSAGGSVQFLSRREQFPDPLAQFLFQRAHFLAPRGQ